MGRFTTFTGVLVLVVAACTAGSSPSPTNVPATATPVTATQAPATPVPTATPAPTATPVAISAAVTFDGKTCVYTGPAVVPRGAAVTFTMTNAPALKKDAKAALLVMPVTGGTTWQQVLAATGPGKSVEVIPPWVNGLKVDGVFPDSVTGPTVTTTTTDDLYLVMCATGPNDTDQGFPALLLKVLPK
jgi:hypothetical protein